VEEEGPSLKAGAKMPIAIDDETLSTARYQILYRYLLMAVNLI
jgi:hypothetical protein